MLWSGSPVAHWGPTPPCQARIQHGLRTLTSLLGLLDLLLDGHLGDLSDDQMEALRRCHIHTHRLCEDVEALS